MSDDAGPDRQAAALAVWQAARIADGRPPSAESIDRVRGALADAAVLLVTVDRADRVVGMGLVVPFRTADGSGPVRVGWAHVSMVFVRPEHQRAGVGTEVMAEILASRGAHTLSLWTRESNVAAQALYRRFGFVATNERMALDEGEPIGRWERSPSESRS